MDRLLDKDPDKRPPDAMTVRGLLALSMDSVVPLTEEEVAAAQRVAQLRANQRDTGSYDISMAMLPREKAEIPWKWFAFALVVGRRHPNRIGTRVGPACLSDHARPEETVRHDLEIALAPGGLLRLGRNLGSQALHDQSCLLAGEERVVGVAHGPFGFE